jgi:hypothetical protein
VTVNDGGGGTARRSAARLCGAHHRRLVQNVCDAALHAVGDATQVRVHDLTDAAIGRAFGHCLRARRAVDDSHGRVDNVDRDVTDSDVCSGDGGDGDRGCRHHVAADIAVLLASRRADHPRVHALMNVGEALHPRRIDRLRRSDDGDAGHLRLRDRLL